MTDSHKMTGPTEINDSAEINDSTETSGAAARAAEARVAAVLRRLEDIHDAAPEDQVQAFAETQRTLAATLSDIDNE